VNKAMTNRHFRFADAAGARRKAIPRGAAAFAIQG